MSQNKTASELRERHGQLISDSEIGDCFRASMSYLLGIPNSNDLPNDHTTHPAVAWWRVLWPFGLTLRWDSSACWVQGLWIASVPSKNYEGEFHAIVMRDTNVEFDPSPKRRYHRGWSLLGKDLVWGGYSLSVHDPRLLGIDFSDLVATEQRPSPC